MIFNNSFLRLKHMRETNKNKGFTLPEVLVALTISISIAAAVAAIVLGGTNLLSSTQETVAVTVKAQAVLDDMTSQLRDATFIVPEDPSNTSIYPALRGQKANVSDTVVSHIAYIYQRNDITCEYQQYWIVDNGNEDYSLRHAANSITGLQPGGSCMGNYYALYKARTQSASSGEEVLTNLTTGSNFTFYGAQGNVGNTTSNGTDFGIGAVCTMDPSLPTGWSSIGQPFRSIGITFVMDSYANNIKKTQTISSLVTPLYTTLGSADC